jgi:hypothetical protein
MKTLHTLLFLVSVLTGFAAPGISVPVTAPVSDDVLLSAIATVETGNNPARLGHRGERSQLQILPQTWRRYSRLPHSQAAVNPAETDRVARAYLAAIRQRLKERGLPETPYFIAAAWNAGPSWRHLTAGTASYAERVANIVATAPRVAAKPAVRTESVATTLTAETQVRPAIAPAPSVLAAPTRPTNPVLASFSTHVPVIQLDDQVAPARASSVASIPTIALVQVGISN